MSFKQDIRLPDGTLFAKEFNRVVHGDRGDYVEFEKEQILLSLISKFGNTLGEDLDIYYWWLYPENYPTTKVYLQKKTVKYAVYKIGKYYVSPDLFKNFKDPDSLFSYCD